MDGASNQPVQPAKKQRTANYTADEKNILFSIIMDYKNLIENKKTDAVTWKEKEAAWHKIGEKFNAQSPNSVFRNVASLKKCYENSKKTTRKNVAHERMEFIKTGGGEATPVTFDKSDNLILSIINSKTVVGLSNPFDSDAIVEYDAAQMLDDEVYSQSLLSPRFGKNAASTSTTTIVEAVPSTSASSDASALVTTPEVATPQLSAIIGQTNNDNRPDWGDYKASNLKTPRTSSLKVNNSQWTSRRRPIAKSLQSSDMTKTYSEVANLKLQMVGIQLAMLKEEGESKRSLIKLQHEETRLNVEMKQLQMEMLKEEREWKRNLSQLQQEETRLDIEIKKLQMQKLKQQLNV